VLLATGSTAILRFRDRAEQALPTRAVGGNDASLFMSNGFINAPGSLGVRYADWSAPNRSGLR